MAQALLDGAFFPIPDDDASPIAAGLRALAGPYELWELDTAAENRLGQAAASLLGTTAYPADFHRPCGEALHWFQLTSAAIECVTANFKIATSISVDGWPFFTEAAKPPFRDLGEFTTWREPSSTDEIVGAFVYENCE